jgi:hypothetical protein
MKFEEVDSKVFSGKEFDYKGSDYSIYINKHNQIRHYYGLDNLKDEHRERLSAAAVPRVNLKKGDWRLIRLSHGALIHTFGPLDSKGDDLYKIIPDHVVRYPSGLNNNYGVFNRKDSSENEFLTRELFCITQAELEAFLKTFAKLFQAFDERIRYPRTTHSNRNSNTCDISQLWIPVNFPYVAAAESQYFWGHISLFGFFRFISWLCFRREQNRSYSHLISNGVPNELLDRIIQTPFEIFWNPIIKHY